MQEEDSVIIRRITKRKQIKTMAIITINSSVV